METLDLIRQVQRSFGDSGSIFITTNDILDWANEAQRTVVRETKCAVVEQVVVASAFPWTKPANFMQVERVIYGTSPLKRILIEDLDAKYFDPGFQNSPAFYYNMDTTVNLYPATYPSDSTNVTIQYSRMPTDLTSAASDISVPLSYHDDLVRYCLARAHERNENYRGMEIAMDEFNTRIAMRIDEEDVNNAEYSVIRDDPYEWL